MPEAIRKKTNRVLVVSNVIGTVLPPVVLISVLVLLWQYTCTARNIPIWLLAKPTDIVKAFSHGNAAIMPNIWVTYSNILIGFALAVVIGLALAILISSFPLFGSALTPLIVALCCIPMVTLVPMLMLIFGLGNNVKIITIVIQAFPLVNMNAVVAFLNTNPTRLELMQSLKASRFQQFRYCILQDSLPGIFSGVKLASIMSMIAGVSAEMTGGNTGLGNRISYFIQFSKTAEAMSCVIYIAILGALLYGGISFLEKKMLKK
ncbi:MAG: ABC transporter permease [Ethanoligenens sp.]|uniref:ABC transporter permease n=1 Tax=Ethanoligenens sp. TaxID=2099655 RepID=UPI0039E7B703